MDIDIYLVLCETEHGTRYWQTTADADLVDNRRLVLGPATVGPSGYATEAEAAEAIADLQEIDLDDPESWPLATGTDPERLVEIDRLLYPPEGE